MRVLQRTGFLQRLPGFPIDCLLVDIDLVGSTAVLSGANVTVESIEVGTVNTCHERLRLSDVRVARVLPSDSDVGAVVCRSSSTDSEHANS